MFSLNARVMMGFSKVLIILSIVAFVALIFNAIESSVLKEPKWKPLEYSEAKFGQQVRNVQEGFFEGVEGMLVGEVGFPDALVYGCEAPTYYVQSKGVELVFCLDNLEVVSE